MKTRIVLLLIVSLLWNCKQKPSKAKEEAPIPNEKPVQSLSPIISELAKFADLTVLDTLDAIQFIDFKQIDENHAVTTIDMNQAVVLYRKMTKREQVTSLPIFEIKDSDTAILFVQGVGFGGAIWATILVDKSTLGIKKIEFDHKAESEGYGAAMTQSSFEDKFVGTKIDLEKNTFTLQKNMESRIDDGTKIDGISGATMTNQGVIEMVNEGLKKYKGYLNH